MPSGDNHDLADPRTLREARRSYFLDNGFGTDGNYEEKWVKLKLGPLPYYLPNAPARVRAVRYHDLHHVLTGYRTDWPGEFAISAWEIASGCADLYAAWVLNLSGMAGGLLTHPLSTFRAFVRGRRSRNLYRAALTDELLDERVDTVRQRLGLDRDGGPARAADVAWFVFYTVVGGLIGGLMLLLGPPFLVYALLSNLARPAR